LEGVLVLLSGSLSGSQASLQSVHIYDVHKKEWYTQSTSSDQSQYPHDRTEACEVVATAPDGSSHNIYIYGGKYMLDTNHYPPLSDVWVLSIPSFQWIQISNSSENTRVGHACKRVNEHYMLSYLGLGPNPCDDYGGIRFLDMNTGIFTTQMTVGESYTVPQKVYEAIGGDKQGNAVNVAPSTGFDDNGLRELFQNITSHNRTIPSTNTTITSNSSRNSNKNIILPATLIPILALTAGSILAFWFWRRRKRARQANAPIELPPANVGSAVKTTQGYYQELTSPGSENYAQKFRTGQRSELEANFPPAYELPVGNSPRKTPSADHIGSSVGSDGGIGTNAPEHHPGFNS